MDKVVTIIVFSIFLLVPVGIDSAFGQMGGTIGDTVFLDQDDDGVQDAGEIGIPGVTVTMDCVSEALRTTTTDADGKYLFEFVPLDEPCTVDADEATVVGLIPGNNCPERFSVILTSAAPSFLGADFCFISLGTIGDTVFLDQDDDGVQDAGEIGIPGVTVTMDCVSEALRTTTTDADGKYLFEFVPLDEPCTVDADEATVVGLIPGNNCPERFSVILTSAAPSFLGADFCFIEEMAIAGEFLPIDSTALFLAGLSQSAIWMIPTVLGLAGAGVIIRHKLRD